MIDAAIAMPQGAEWLIILAIVVLVFGAAKLPELARGTGQALRIFKTETKGLRDGEDNSNARATTEGVSNAPHGSRDSDAQDDASGDLLSEQWPDKHRE